MRIETMMGSVDRGFAATADVGSDEAFATVLADETGRAESPAPPERDAAEPASRDDAAPRHDVSREDVSREDVSREDVSRDDVKSAKDAEAMEVPVEEEPEEEPSSDEEPAAEELMGMGLPQMPVRQETIAADIASAGTEVSRSDGQPEAATEAVGPAVVGAEVEAAVATTVDDAPVVSVARELPARFDATSVVADEFAEPESAQAMAGPVNESEIEDETVRLPAAHGSSESPLDEISGSTAERGAMFVRHAAPKDARAIQEGTQVATQAAPSADGGPMVDAAKLAHAPVPVRADGAQASPAEGGSASAPTWVGAAEAASGETRDRYAKHQSDGEGGQPDLHDDTELVEFAAPVDPADADSAQTPEMPRPMASRQPASPSASRIDRVQVGQQHVEAHRQLDALVRGRRQRVATSAVNNMTLRHAASADVEVADLGRIRVDARTVAGEVDVDVRTLETGSAAVLQSLSAHMEGDLRNSAIDLRNLDIREEAMAAFDRDSRSGSHADERGHSSRSGSGRAAAGASTDEQSPAVTPDGRVRIVL